jgi:hypothetical protein
LVKYLKVILANVLKNWHLRPVFLRSFTFFKKSIKKVSLQNRVNPFGALISTSERGAWTGNRGVIHNHSREIVKNHAAKYWITCSLKYKNFQRVVMTPNRWTELFFLDEATAFAAGHRPCGFCRHPDFKKFKNLWLKANGARFGMTEKTSISEIDAIIHAERLDENGAKKTFKATLPDLPDGVFVTDTAREKTFLWWQQQLFEWSFSGYSKAQTVDNQRVVEVLTPFSYVEVFRAGYLPQVFFEEK